MSENDFNAAYPPDENIERGRKTTPARGLEPDVRTQLGVPVSSEPIEPLEPVGPLDPIEPIQPPRVGAGSPLTDRDASATWAADEESDAGKGQEVKDEARELAHDGVDSAKHVGNAAKREAGAVMDDVRDQASNLMAELGADVSAQAATHQEKIATNLRQISDELRGMVESSDTAGTASSLVDQAARHSGNAADWLAAREPGDLLDEVKGFARRRPGAFLGIALGAGLLVGRITRNAGSGPDSGSDDDTSTGRLPQAGPPRTASQLPPTINQTMGSGGVGGTGSNPGAGVYPSAVQGNEPGYTGS